MIRLFTGLCKSFLKEIIDVDIFQAATDSFRHYGQRCPNCRAFGKLFPYGGYFRFLVSLYAGMVVCHRIKILRFKCKSCNRTHALLPDTLVPHSSFSLKFKLLVLIAYFEREEKGETVVSICHSFEIAISTIYEWKKLFLSHKELLLGVFLNQKKSELSFLRSLVESGILSDTIRKFFERHAFSFMQHKPDKATRSRAP
jgi:transposase-like protein